MIYAILVIASVGLIIGLATVAVVYDLWLGTREQ